MQLTEEQFQKEVIDWVAKYSDREESLVWALEWTADILRNHVKYEPTDEYEHEVQLQRSKRLKAIALVKGVSVTESIEMEVKPWMVLPKNPQSGP